MTLYETRMHGEMPGIILAGLSESFAQSFVVAMRLVSSDQNERISASAQRA